MRKFSLIIILVLIAVLTTGIHADGERQVFAFYYSWWTNESWSDSRLLDTPLTPYDLRDPAATAAHIDTARAAGLDGFIIDWFGLNMQVAHQAFETLLNESQSRDFQISALVDLHEPGYLQEMNQLSAALQYLYTTAIPNPAYSRINGKPVVYFWDAEFFSISTWEQLRTQYDPNHDALWLMQGAMPAYMTAFDGFFILDIAFANDPAGTFQMFQNQAAQAGADYYLPTVIPGWDTSTFAGWNSFATPSVPRDNGTTLFNNWSAAAAYAQQNVLVINSWNGYFENSHIEPSVDYGTQALDSLTSLIAEWKGA